MPRLLAIPLILLTAACATTTYTDTTKFGAPIAGWPELTVVEHHLSDAEMRAACAMVMPSGPEPAGCAYVHLDTARCDVYFGQSRATHALVRSHELKHCAGRDHVGDSRLYDLWRKWQLWESAVARSRDELPTGRN